MTDELAKPHDYRVLLEALVPVELKESPIEKVRTTFAHQMPWLEQMISTLEPRR